MSEFRIGTAFVEVHARTENVIPEAERALRAGKGRFQSAGDEAGRAYGESFTRGADGRLRDARGRFVTAGAAAGDGFGNALAGGVGRGAQQAGGHLNRLGSSGGSSLGAIGRGAAMASLNVYALAAAAGAAAASIGALPGLASAVGLMGGTIMAAFNGVGAALQGYKADQDAASTSAAKGASTARSNARAIRDAASAIDDARRNQARVAVQTGEAIEAAGRRVTAALAAETSATEDLNEARREATEQLKDLREQVSDYALDEAGAELAVREAKIRLDTANRDIASSSIQREQASHALKVAEERLSDIQRERGEAAAELAAAEKAGVEGAPGVVAAHEAVSQASRSVADAKTEEQRTIRDAGLAQEDAARQVASAIQSLADVQAQQAESANVAAASSSKYRDAMSELTPAGRALVLQLLAMKPLIDGLSDTAAEAFLPGVTSMLRDSEGLFPIFDDAIRRTGTTMGETALKFGDLFKSDEFKTNLDTMLKSADPIIRAVGDLLVGATESLVWFGAEMAPVTDDVAFFIDSVKIGLKGFFEAIAPHKESFEKIFQQLGILAQWALPMLGEAIGVAADALAWFLEFVNRAKVKLGEWGAALDRVAAWPDEMGQKMRQKFDDLMRSIGQKWTDLKDGTIRKARELIDGVMGWFGGLRDRAADAFRRAADAVGAAFDGIREKAKAPVRWVIDVVYNNGIRGLWDKVRGVFGGDPLPHFMPFKRGGLVPGQDLGYDYVPAMLRGGEGVLVPEAVRAVGGAAGIERLNRMAEAQHFATGGVAGARSSGSASVTSATGSVQGSGGFLSTLLTDPVGAVKSLFSGVLSVVRNMPGAGVLRDSLTTFPTKVMDLLIEKARNFLAGGGIGDANSASGVGFQWQMAMLRQAFPGLALISGFRPGSITSTGNRSYHGQGRAVDIPPSMAVFNWIASNFGARTKELIFTPAGGRQIHNGRPHVFTGGTIQRDHYDHVHWAFDKGGIARGVGMLPKRTPEPERVLSPRQTEAFERLVAVLDGGSTGQTVNIHMQQPPGSPAEAGRFVALALRSA